MKYAVDTSIEFNGRNYHCLTDQNVNMFTGKTFEDMQTDNPGMVLLEEDEFNDKYYIPHIESYRTEWSEVTEDKWNDLYECLPPYRTGSHRGVFLFCCPEATIDYMHTWGAQKDGKFYFATRSKYDKKDELIKDLP